MNSSNLLPDEVVQRVSDHVEQTQELILQDLAELVRFRTPSQDPDDSHFAEEIGKVHGRIRTQKSPEADPRNEK